MRVWLDQVREEPFSWDETESVAVEELDRPELLGIGPVSWHGELSFVDPGYLLRARLSYDQTLGCIRCLMPHAVKSGGEVELLIMLDLPRTPKTARPTPKPTKAPEGRHSREIEQELLEDDLGVVVLGEEFLDTRPLLLEQLQLNIPMKPLCRPDCLGLCPECGADRNRPGACSCGAPAADPRWAALATIRSRVGGSGSDPE
ncbi:MAG TPA: DUF177 domain-containing protein [Thermoanaerobaculia bacterium]|nr:DUF177 domain-containing protein [Thermoanaerobaculia bacterium]